MGRIILMGVVTFVLLIGFWYLSIFIKYCDIKIKEYKHKRWEKSFKIGDKFYKVVKQYTNPFDEHNREEIQVEIVDVKYNYKNECYVKFRYLSTERLYDHRIRGNDDKINTIYSMPLKEFSNHFKDRFV